MYSCNATRALPTRRVHRGADRRPVAHAASVPPVRFRRDTDDSVPWDLEGTAPDVSRASDRAPSPPSPGTDHDEADRDHGKSKQSPTPAMLPMWKPYWWAPPLRLTAGAVATGTVVSQLMWPDEEGQSALAFGAAVFVAIGMVAVLATCWELTAMRRR